MVFGHSGGLLVVEIISNISLTVYQENNGKKDRNKSQSIF